MAKATTSKLNSKLPTVSKIAFCTSAGRGMATKIYTLENGKFSIKVGFKQNSKTYPFQIQYRQRSRYTNANAKAKGANWTGWSAWKNAVAVSGIPIDRTESQNPSNRWMKANKGVNKNGTYQTFYTFTNYQIPEAYDTREFQFRVRTFNKSKARHGNWTTQSLTVYKRAHLLDDTLITASDGGMRCKFNYVWDRSCTLQVDSIVDADGRELLRKPYTVAVKKARLNSETTPKPRTGYRPGQLDIPMARIKRKVAAGETLTTKMYFVTGDGAKTRITHGAVIEPKRDIPVNVTYSWDEPRGILTVSANNAGSVTLLDIGCSVSYTYNSKRYAMAPYAKSVNLSGLSKFYFVPPIGTALSIHVKEEDANDYKDEETVSGVTLGAAGYRLNKLAKPTICGVAWGEPSYSVEKTPQYETELPYGREHNVIFYGLGSESALELRAKVVDKPNLYGGSHARKLAWDNVANNQGVYVFRTNKGDMYTVGLTGVQLEHESKDMYDLSVSMVEVV